MARFLESGYSGKIYPVNPRADEILGLKAYPNLEAVPGPVDYAILNVPAKLTLQVLEDCIDKGVKIVHVFASGFEETGKEEGKKLQAALSKKTKDGGVRLLGPNCFGIYYPSEGLTFQIKLPRKSGPVAFVSQSGANCIRLVNMASLRGIHFSKVISYGNAADLDAADFLRYLEQDPETEIICCYIEGVRDGRPLFDAARSCAQKKPLILLKAGLTQGGSRAARFHTAADGGSYQVWDAFFKQTGAIEADSLEEMVDLLAAFLHLPTPRGRRVAVVGRGGGTGVLAAEICEREGLAIPSFSQHTLAELERMIPRVGICLNNPVEPPQRSLASVKEFMGWGLELIEKDPQIDIIFVHLFLDIFGPNGSDLEPGLEEVVSKFTGLSTSLTKPVVIVLYPGGRPDTANVVSRARERLFQAGVPVYPSFESAARAVSRYMRYRELFSQKESLNGPSESERRG